MLKKKEICIALVVLFVFVFQIALKLSGNNAVVAGAASSRDLAVVMYHSILADESKCGKYVITPELLESDLAYLRDNGYDFVSLEEIINYVAGVGSLPQKPVLLTFDDGYYNNYSYVFPLLEEYDAHAVISPVGAWSDEFSREGAVLNNNYSYLTWDNIREMSYSGRVEFGNHTYDLHTAGSRHGADILWGETPEHYFNTVGEDILKLQDLLTLHTDISPVCFTYPFGFYGEQSENLITQLGFAVSLSCEEGLNPLTVGGSLHLLKRVNRPWGVSSADFFAKIFS